MFIPAARSLGPSSRPAATYVSSGGVASSTTVSGGGTQVLTTGGSAGFTTVSRGGTEVLSGGTASGTTIDPGGMIDPASLAYASGGSAGVNSSGLLSVSVGGHDDTTQLAGSYAGGTFELSRDAGSGTLVTLTEPPRTLTWTGASSTAFTTAANWDDLTDAENPATTPPDNVDTAEFLATGGVPPEACHRRRDRRHRRRHRPDLRRGR